MQATTDVSLAQCDPGAERFFMNAARTPIPDRRKTKRVGIKLLGYFMMLSSTRTIDECIIMNLSREGLSFIAKTGDLCIGRSIKVRIMNNERPYFLNVRIVYKMASGDFYQYGGSFILREVSNGC